MALVGTGAMTGLQADAHAYSITRIFRESPRPARRTRSSVFWKGAPDHGLASRRSLPVRRRIPGERRSAFRQRHDGAALSEPVRQAAGPGSFILDRERALGVCEP